MVVVLGINSGIRGFRCLGFEKMRLISVWECLMFGIFLDVGFLLCCISTILTVIFAR